MPQKDYSAHSSTRQAANPSRSYCYGNAAKRGAAAEALPREHLDQIGAHLEELYGVTSHSGQGVAAAGRIHGGGERGGHGALRTPGEGVGLGLLPRALRLGDGSVAPQRPRAVRGRGAGL